MIICCHESLSFITSNLPFFYVAPPPPVTMVEHIILQDICYAIIVRSQFHADGIRFFTPSSFSQQLGYMCRPRGYIVKPHVHNPVPREVIHTNEVLFIRSGRVRVDFYSDDQIYLESRVLETGDVILLASGGHGFEMLESSEIIEVKQGPYAGDQDKTHFQGISSMSMTAEIC